MAALREVSALNDMISFREFVQNYYKTAFPSNKWTHPAIKDCTLEDVQAAYVALRDRLTAESWELDEYREEMLIAAEAVCIVAELSNIFLKSKSKTARLTDTEAWIAKFRAKWVSKNKESELSRVEQFFRDCEALANS